VGLSLLSRSLGLTETSAKESALSTQVSPATFAYDLPPTRMGVGSLGLVSMLAGSGLGLGSGGTGFAAGGGIDPVGAGGCTGATHASYTWAEPTAGKRWGCRP
jgi:hypothetical protein